LSVLDLERCKNKSLLEICFYSVLDPKAVKLSFLDRRRCKNGPSGKVDVLCLIYIIEKLATLLLYREIKATKIQSLEHWEYLQKVSKFQNESMKSSFLPKYELNIVRISALYCVTLKGRNRYNFWFIFWEKR
jgi:hypothetical protein